MRAPLRATVPLAAMALLSAACSNPVTLRHRAPTSVPGTSSGLVGIGPFTDERGEDSPTWIGAIRGGYGNPLKDLESTEPVAELVRSFFTEGLRARGLLAAPSEARLLLNGAVVRLYCDQVVRREADVSVRTTLVDVGSGREVLAETFSRTNIEGSDFLALDSGILGSVEGLRAMVEKTLQQVVDNALDDPRLRAALRDAAASPAP